MPNEITKPKMMLRFEPRQEAGVLELFIYDSIESDHYEFFSGEKIKSETSQDYFRTELAKYPDVKQINLYVNSSGGSVYEAMGIRAQLMRHPATVTAFVDGWAASAASLILTGCDKVVMDSASMQMIHNMWILAVGNATKLRETADALDKMMEGNRQAYLDKSGDKLSEDKLTELMNKETWLTAKECADIGLCDEITKIAPSEKSATSEQRVVAMRQSLIEVVAAAAAVPEEIQPDPPDVDKPPEAGPEPEEPAQHEEGGADKGGSFDLIAAIARAAERSINNGR